MPNFRLRALLLICATVLVTGCGFQLRGTYPLPFASLYIDQPPTTELYAGLSRTIRTGSHVNIVATREEAEVMLQILSDQRSKDILSLSAAGRVSEYQLIRTLDFRLVDPAGREWMPSRRITVRRDISYNDDQVLSKESEENLLWRDMQQDLVQQLLRRLVTAQAPTQAKESAAEAAIPEAIPADPSPGSATAAATASDPAH